MTDSEFSLKNSLKDILFGSLSGCTGKLIEYPFDTVKVRLQSQPHDQPLKYKNSFDCIKQTFTNEGFFGFYRGISSPIVGAAAENACLFVTYNIAQDFLKNQLSMKQNEELPLNLLVLSGGFSGCVASYILTPIELIKCKLQVEQVYSQKKSSIIQLIKQVLTNDGIKGFWHGQTGTLLRECGGTASWFGAYEFMSKELKIARLGSENINGAENTISELLISGACAGISYNLSLFPADTIKSKMQTSSVVNPDQKLTFISTAKLIYKHGGLKAFYRGLGITLTRAVPSNAVIFFTYEKLKKTFA
ncbi:hypothetical protein WICANDRAFT_49726 [Wickerhamomyces anomalus NRRL Y-366-8]|uniref:Mitochondrial ornithine carrier protein n=1 Tax=Wickerhamomyces anomalus (strain ATCC 58044 / CBS 1984 / NCYC 433 / NRRL Y-366-8) TaxID=683960 RepID=A0A1E3PBN6_WICAA|nr:uncharacterized protein WICANDRAFT_49726 [Wickerhamomyces anomalus NRRL Y-366-8]ODQ62297.1 hypothetical protein WICANDRAFT_49726 [Wickerhamomyces anomalus NRRL Y-366-8]